MITAGPDSRALRCIIMAAAGLFGVFGAKRKVSVHRLGV